MNRQAVRIANEVAAEGGALVAGNICNTWAYDPRDPEASGAVVRAQYEEQLGWAVEEGVDFVIAETNDYVGEALHRARGVPGARPAGHGHVRQRAARRPPTTATTTSRRAGSWPTRGATIVGPQLLARPGDDAAAARADPRGGRRRGGRAAGPLPHVAGDAGLRVAGRRRRPARCSRSSSSRSSARASRWRTSRAAPRDIGVDYIGICCGGGPHHVRAMAEALGRETPASRYSPAIELHPVLGTPRDGGEHELMGGWAAGGRAAGGEPTQAGAALRGGRARRRAGTRRCRPDRWPPRRRRRTGGPARGRVR